MGLARWRRLPTATPARAPGNAGASRLHERSHPVGKGTAGGIWRSGLIAVVAVPCPCAFPTTDRRYAMPTTVRRKGALTVLTGVALFCLPLYATQAQQPTDASKTNFLLTIFLR